MAAPRRKIPTESYDLKIRVPMLGDSGVGKTCLLLQYVDKKFSLSYVTTIGIDYKPKVVNVGGRKVLMQIWDTAGQERFRTITTGYIRGTDAVALVYDCTDRESFDNIMHWSGQIKAHAGDGIPVVLIGNKTDLVDEAVISEEEARALAKRLDAPFIAASAKNNVNVTEAFEHVARVAVERLDKVGASAKHTKPGGKVDLKSTKKTEKKGCCS